MNYLNVLNELKDKYVVIKGNEIFFIGSLNQCREYTNYQKWNYDYEEFYEDIFSIYTLERWFTELLNYSENHIKSNNWKE